MISALAAFLLESVHRASNATTPFVQNVRVDHRRTNIAVAEKLLNREYVLPTKLRRRLWIFANERPRNIYSATTSAQVTRVSLRRPRDRSELRIRLATRREDLLQFLRRHHL